VEEMEMVAVTVKMAKTAKVTEMAVAVKTMAAVTVKTAAMTVKIAETVAVV
jgi:hypothetical protein